MSSGPWPPRPPEPRNGDASRGLAGRSDIGYVLARQYRFTFLGDQPRCVSVSSHDLGPVVDLNDFFVAGLPPGENHPASSRSEDRRAGSCGEIDAGMELQTTIERIDTIAEPRAKSSAVRRPPVTSQEVKTTRPIHLGLLREKLQCLGKTGDLASRTVKLLRLPCSSGVFLGRSPHKGGTEGLGDPYPHAPCAASTSSSKPDPIPG